MCEKVPFANPVTNNEIAAHLHCLIALKRMENKKSYYIGLKLEVVYLLLREYSYNLLDSY